ncbi:YicC/YloC family endoribonuclease [Roseivivax sp.]
MTGFASAEGATEGLSWAWDIRGVNGKGLDLRLRVPDWIEGLEPALRARAQARLARGSVSVSLKLAPGTATARQSVNDAALSDVLAALTRVEAAARTEGLSLTPASAAEVLGLRGVMEEVQTRHDPEVLRGQLVYEFDALLEAFIAARAEEGAALSEILKGQLDRMATLIDTAEARAEARRPEQAERLKAQLARVMDNTEGLDPARIAQELALIAVKSDVTEEIDRLRAHIAAARGMLAAEGAVGRKLDFLMQEFNREANTLCSKAGSAPLTEVGLELKTLIEQMREQIQNVE